MNVLQLLLPLSRLLTRAKYTFLRSQGGNAAVARAQGVTVGEDCRILIEYFGTEPWLISIGDRVTVAASVNFITHDGSTWLIRDRKGRRYHYAPIDVGSDVFIGSGSTIMPGVRIGARCIVAAGSVVTRSLPSGYVAAGVPARIIARFDDYERKVLTFPSDADTKGTNPRERIDSVVDTRLLPELVVPIHLEDTTQAEARSARHDDTSALRGRSSSRLDAVSLDAK